MEDSGDQTQKKMNRVVSYDILGLHICLTTMSLGVKCVIKYYNTLHQG